MWLKDNMGGSNLHTVTALCEREMYGKYVPGAHGGSASDSDSDSGSDPDSGPVPGPCPGSGPGSGSD